MRSRHDFEIQVYGWEKRSRQLQQDLKTGKFEHPVYRYLERILLLNPGSPLPLRGGQRGIGQEEQLEHTSGKVTTIIVFTINLT